MNTIVTILAILAGKATAFVDVGDHVQITLQHLHEDSSTEYIPARYFTQRLDHFNISVPHTFQQRYFERDTFWKADGPIFIVIGGEGDARKDDVFGGITEQLAKETNGALYALEHRYYGASLPFQLEHNFENMKYLSSRQALADLADFIVHLKGHEKYKNSKVVVIGGSYAGNLAAWMRAKYPNLVDAALASSAPLLAKAYFADYYTAVAYVYKKYGGDLCYYNVKSIISKVRDHFSSKNSTEKLKKMVNICQNSSVDNEDNQRFLLRILSMTISSYVQFGDAQSVKDQCAQFANMNEDEMLDLETEDCIDIDYQKYLQSKRLDPWKYQQCTEFGFSPHGMQLFCQQCSVILGRPFSETSIEEAVNRTNAYYGGLESGTTRVLFTHGSLDPWARLGVTAKQNTLQTPVIIMQGKSHCSDLDDPNESDSEHMKINRAQIKFWIKYWLENEDEIRIDQQW